MVAHGPRHGGLSKESKEQSRIGLCRQCLDGNAPAQIPDTALLLTCPGPTRTAICSCLVEFAVSRSAR